ncbi:stonustoxin subunit beta-like [Epinephelus fuscoguttatus]|uniref:stonustoxin subunit beta-like n=1 Tax=Epinephelus fuscoguttatus TaxID=293821 RepID=UPI0020D1D6C8|nr:stonustoxin subunit beta-like [Epinephelus fuscoguttatus]
MASDMTVASLGRPFGLGMLYDACRDALIPGLTLWDKKTLQENTAERSEHSSAFNISASDSIEDKSSLLDVSASLKLSFCSGLIEVRGSAEYLNDEKKFKNQSRVTCQYKANTNFKELSLINIMTMDTKQTDVIKKSGATHVVTGILYGANAFFVFDSEKLEASKVQNVQGSMEAVIKKIPTFSIEGRAEIKLSDEEKDLTKKFSCKFFGDFILKSNPATFKDAVKVYVQLPQLLREKGENAVSLMVWLMPLTNLDTKAAELSRDISNTLVWRVQDALEDLRETGIRCNDSLEDRVVENFPVIREELSQFQKLCSDFATNLRQTLAKILPSIRDGEAEESSVEELFEDRDKSPFSREKLSKWLDDKEREINVIRSCVDIMEGIKTVRNQSELDREVLASDVANALCFVFTSMERGDTYLDQMATYLKSSTLGSTNEEPWYFSDEIFSNMRKKAKEIRDLAKAQKNNNRLRILIATIANEKYKGATIYHYKEGNLASEDFTKLDPPDVEAITDREDLIWYATDLTLDPNTANRYLTLSEGDKKATCGKLQSYPDHPERFDVHPQVLCKESLTGRHYWEVEWSTGSTEWVYIAVIYKGIERKAESLDSQFGFNTMSWAVDQYRDSPNHLVKAYHNGLQWETAFPSDGCDKVGVYLDWPAGTLSYYRVSSNTLRHLYTFRTKFTEPVYPGFWAAKDSNFAYLCPVQ